MSCWIIEADEDRKDCGWVTTEAFQCSHCLCQCHRYNVLICTALQHGQIY